MSTKRQFKMYLSDDLYEKLKHAAEKLGKNSGQEVAEEIISIYFPVWMNVNDSMNRAVQYQTNVVAEEIISNKKKELESKASRSKSQNKTGVLSSEITLEDKTKKRKTGKT